MGEGGGGGESIHNRLRDENDLIAILITSVHHDRTLCTIKLSHFDRIWQQSLF